MLSLSVFKAILFCRMVILDFSMVEILTQHVAGHWWQPTRAEVTARMHSWSM